MKRPVKERYIEFAIVEEMLIALFLAGVLSSQFLICLEQAVIACSGSSTTEKHRPSYLSLTALTSLDCEFISSIVAMHI